MLTQICRRPGDVVSIDLMTHRRGRPTAIGQACYRSLDVNQQGSDDKFEVRLSVDLSTQSARSVHVAAFLRLRLDDPRIEVIDLRVLDTQSFTTSVCVLADGMFGWLIGDPIGAEPIPSKCQVFALIKVPQDRTALAATAHVDTTVIHKSRWPFVRGQREHARATCSTTFAVRLPAGWVGQVRPTAPVHAGGTRSGVRLCMAADMERFSRFRLPEATRAQQRFVEILAKAREHAGIQESDVDLQESGDGQFAVFPTGLDETYVIPKLVEGLQLTLATQNSDLSDRARLRLRVALHRGHMAPAPNGWVGRPTIAVRRMVDSDPLRIALTGTPAADFALIVPDVLYQEVIMHRYGLLDPDEFVPTNITVPAKNFTEPAWLYAPGR